MFYHCGLLYFLISFRDQIFHCINHALQALFLDYWLLIHVTINLLVFKSIQLVNVSATVAQIS